METNYKSSSTEFKSDTKQITEQKIVTDYILDIFKNYSKKIDFNKVPVIKKTSNIEHLCTTISALIDEKVNIFDLIHFGYCHHHHFTNIQEFSFSLDTTKVHKGGLWA